MDAEVGGKKEEIRGSRKRQVRQRSRDRDFTDGCWGSREGKREDGERKTSNNQREEGKGEGEETRKLPKEEVQNWYKEHEFIHGIFPPTFFLVPYSLFLIPCSLFLVPYSLFLLPCSFFLVPSSWHPLHPLQNPLPNFLLPSINRGQYLRTGPPTALHRRQQWQLFRQKPMV